MTRTVALLAAALATGLAGISVPTSADAQSRRVVQVREPLRVVVTPRSYLDAGRVVPVGSQNNYARVGVQTTAPVWATGQDRYGEAVLPPRGFPLFSGARGGPFDGEF